MLGLLNGPCLLFLVRSGSNLLLLCGRRLFANLQMSGRSILDSLALASQESLGKSRENALKNGTGG